MRNFRVFRGEHSLDLEPEDKRDKPLILIGGLNGSGKTSILMAIRLALYGAQAFDDIFTKQAYVEKLTSLIHKGKPDEFENFTNAYVELNFSLHIDGEAIDYLATRSWSRDKGDKLTICENNIELTGKSYEQLQGFLNELIPVGVGDLFFFDGEKIATLAEDDTGGILRIAIQRMLGLDVVTRLKNDLGVYIKNEEQRKISGEVKESINYLEEKKQSLLELAKDKRNQSVVFLNKIQANLATLRKYEALLISQGKVFADSKVSEKAKLKELEIEKSQIEKQLRNAIDSYFPMALAPSIFMELFNLIDKEKKISQANAFQAGLEVFLKNLQNELALRSSTTLKIATETIQDQLIDFVASQPNGEIILDVSEREANVLHHAVYSLAPKQKKEKEVLCAELRIVQHAMEQAENNISRAPEDGQLSGTVGIIRDYDKSINDAVNNYKKLNIEANNALNQALQYAREQQKMHDEIKDKITHDSAGENALNTMPLLDEYIQKLSHKRIAEVEIEFSRVYQKLARKGELKLTAKINRSTYNVELMNEDGAIIDRKLLSAGEKQIYAITMLEALGNVSGKVLPVIIDTPLGRLDSHHRDKLVENYLPEASHQVIILSTDTEIDEVYYRNYLRDCISKSYEIKYSHLNQSSSIKKGYFWEIDKHEVNV